MPSKTTAKKKPAAAQPEPAPRPLSIEERTAYLESRLQGARPDVHQKYRDDLDMSWIAHDSALEGVVYTVNELGAAIGPGDPAAPFDSSTQPAVEEIRRHREALNYVREQATKRRVPLTLDTVKKIYTVLHPEEGDLKTVKYRKDIPQHRLYFHEYAPPDKIAYKLRQVVARTGAGIWSVKVPLRNLAATSSGTVAFISTVPEPSLVTVITSLYSKHPDSAAASAARQANRATRRNRAFSIRQLLPDGHGQTTGILIPPDGDASKSRPSRCPLHRA